MTDDLELTQLDYVARVWKSYKAGDIINRQRWRWTLTARNGRIVAVSGEGYANKSHAAAMAAKLFPLASQEISE